MSNQHISQFLDYYIKLPNPQYAVLLKGKWGSGKTHFINKYKDKLEENKQRHIYVSLYGVTSYDEIETKFLQSSNPKIFNEKSLFIGKLTDAFINENIKKSLGQMKKSLSFLNAKGNILIFDDLERCSINIVDLLGYINNFVEHLSYKVILIANEEEFKKTEKYTQIKEKLIGKTFEFILDVDSAYDSFLCELKNEKDVREKILEKYKNRIVEIFEKSETKNLRFLRQGLFDFERFHDSVFDNKHYNDDFLNDFISVFFSSFFEHKSDNKIYDILNIDKIREKYKLKDNYKILDISIWKDVFENSFIDVEKIQNEIDKSKYFNLDIDNIEIFKLANIWDIESEKEFNLLINSVYTKFDNLEYKKINQIEFVVSIFLFLSENKIYEKDENEIKDIIKQYFDGKIFSNDEIFESNNDRHDHRSYLNYLYFKSEKLDNILIFIKELESEIVKNYLKSSLNNYKNKFNDIIKTFKMINKYKQFDILNYINVDDFVEYLISLTYFERSNFKDFFSERYTDLSKIDLEKEVLFLDELLKKLEIKVSNKGKFTKYIFENFIELITEYRLKLK